MKTELMDYFILSDNEQTFTLAIQPKSCGGGDAFKFLALYGDRVLNLTLLDIISDKGINNSSQITELIQSFHNEKTLAKIAGELKIDQLMKESFEKEKITQNDLKESIEALLGGIYKAKGLSSSKNVVMKLLHLSNKYSYFISNPKGQLQNLFQKKNIKLPEYLTKRTGGPDHLQEFQCNLKVEFEGKKYDIKSKITHNKQEAEKESAMKFLTEIGEVYQMNNYWTDLLAD
ncbi:MAG: putative dsRNA-binding protein [Candidatus Hodarchaeales archaeon]|jgi:dsRNA-specific ribonuclease